MKIKSTEDSKYVIARRSIEKKNKKKKIHVDYLYNDRKFYEKLNQNTLFFNSFSEAENFLITNKKKYSNTDKYTYHVSNTMKNSNKYSIIKEKSIEEWIQEEGKFILNFIDISRYGCAYTKLCPSAKWNLGSVRYKNILNAKDLKCVECGKEVKTARLEKSLYDTDEIGEFTYHWNFYAEDGTLMTCDHIIPKSKGGTNDVDNIQIMCVNCNFEKGDTYDYPSYVDDYYDYDYDEDDLEEDY